MTATNVPHGRADRNTSTQTEYTQNNESLEPRATRKICMKGHEVEEEEEEDAGGGEVDKEEVQVQKEEVSKISKNFLHVLQLLHNRQCKISRHKPNLPQGI